MIGYRDLLMSQEHYQELRREAENERLIRQARTAGAHGMRLHGRALSWLGGRMVVWGQGLQTRYSTTAALITHHNS